MFQIAQSLFLPLELLFICLHVCFLPSSIFRPPLLLKLSLTISSFLPWHEKERRFGVWSANELMERQNISRVFISRPRWKISLLLGVYPLISDRGNKGKPFNSKLPPETAAVTPSCHTGSANRRSCRSCCLQEAAFALAALYCFHENSESLKHKIKSCCCD